jgi:hypothetical protein
MAKVPKARQRADSLQRVVKTIDTARRPLDGIKMALRKMFGPLTPEERRDLSAATKRVKRDAERLLRFLAKPRKRVASRRSPKKGD